MTSVKGVADKWETIPSIRTGFRDHGRLFYSLDAAAQGRVPRITVKEAAHHAEVLKPLLRCMRKAPRDSKGKVRLFGKPACEKQTFVFII